MTSSRIKNPLCPKYWLHTLTAGLSIAAGAGGRTIDSLMALEPNAPATDRSIASGLAAPRHARNLADAPTGPQGPLKTIQRSGLPPALGYGDTVVPLKGFNIYAPHAQLCGISDEEFDAALDAMVNESGVNAVRMWAFEGMFPEGDWSSIDHALSKTQNSGVSLTVALSNQWGDCEPLNSTSNVRLFKSVDWYRSGYQDSYRGYVQRFAARYANATSMTLQLINEAVAGDLISPMDSKSGWQCINETDSSQVLQAFARDMVEVVHAEAPQMLVGLGTRGEQGDCGTNGDNYGSIAAEVDICDIHSYGMNLQTIANRMGLCFNQSKPIIMSESASLRLDSEEDEQWADIGQAQSLIQSMQQLSQGGLAGTHLWWYRTNSSMADNYSMDVYHPIQSMLSNLTTVDLIATAESIQYFQSLLSPPSPSLSPSAHSTSSGCPPGAGFC